MRQSAGMTSTPLRNTLGSALFVVGCSLYASSNVLGHGWNTAPDPSKALLVSAAGMMMCVLSLLVMPDSSDRREVINMMKAVFAIGCVSLLATLVLAVVHPFFDLYNQSWGAIPPPQIIFGAMYGAISVTAVLAIQMWEQQDRAVCDLVR
jgi:hypothetical protein